MLHPVKPRLASPILHHNGQIKAVSQVLDMIPPHDLYNEPFGGGAVMLFAKEPARLNVVNDPNGEIVNFYETMVTDFDALEMAIQRTLHSREQFQRAQQIYAAPSDYTRVERAWAVWAMSKMSYMYTLDDASFTFARGRQNRMSWKIANAKNKFTEEHKQILELCTIEHDDPLEVLRRYDAPDTFHYVAPPIDGSCDMMQLPTLLANLRGKFMFITRGGAVLSHFADLSGWAIYALDRKRRAACAKEEWVVTNY